MSYSRSLANTCDRLENQLGTTCHHSLNSRPHDTEYALRRYSRCIEEIRQNQVYEAFKQDVAEWIELDTIGLDLFDDQDLSTCDLIESAKTATTLSFTEAAHLGDHHALVQHLIRSTAANSSGSYIANQEALPTPIAHATSPCCQTLRCCRVDVCRQPHIPTAQPAYPPCGVKHPSFSHNPTEEEGEVLQTRLERDRSQRDLISPATPISGRLFEPIQSHPDIVSHKIPTILDNFIFSQLEADGSSIRDIGFVNSEVVVRDDLSERAHVSSQFGEISNMSTPGLTYDDESDYLDDVKQEESANEMFSSAFRLCVPTNSTATASLRDNSATAQSPNLTVGRQDDEQTVDDNDQCEDSHNFQELGAFENDESMLHTSPVVSREELFDFHTPECAQDFLDSDKENMMPSYDATFVYPAIHPDCDTPDTYISAFEKAQQDECKNHHAVHDLGEPGPLAHISLGRPEESSMIKRRTKKAVSRDIPPSHQLLPTTTYSQNSGLDIASFFRANSRYSFVDPKIPLPPVRISKKPSYNDSPRIKKRSARESFDLIELCHENAEKARSQSSQEESRGTFDLIELCHENIARKQSRKRPRLDIKPVTPISAQLPPTPSSTISLHFNGSPMATALKGYPGQFEIHKPRKTSNANDSTTATQHVFGNHLHANGEIINLNFTPDVLANKSDLSDLPNISTTIEHANLHHAFAEEIFRSSEEEDLRKEAYRECAAARLEGVPVGYYRYFAGHMTVEEYNEAKMCVCWEGCWCTKICTHYGDCVCPCAEDLVIGEGM